MCVCVGGGGGQVCNSLRDTWGQFSCHSIATDLPHVQLKHCCISGRKIMSKHLKDLRMYKCILVNITVSGPGDISRLRIRVIVSCWCRPA